MAIQQLEGDSDQRMNVIAAAHPSLEAETRSFSFSAEIPIAFSSQLRS
jgi:hypothetical protein